MSTFLHMASQGATCKATVGFCLLLSVLIGKLNGNKQISP